MQPITFRKEQTKRNQLIYCSLHSPHLANKFMAQ